MDLSESNKAKMAKRVIEVLEFFDDEHPEATVMDIVRRFDWPQSSTSELLSSLVDLGLLYKDPNARSYCPTPRVAMLGGSVQPSLVRDGQLLRLIDRLSAQTGLALGVFGMVGLNVQIYSWRSGKRMLQPAGDFHGGRQAKITDSAVGWLLLSTVAKARREGMLRRLNAEAPDDRKFSFAEMAARVETCRSDEHVTGPAGFGSATAEITGVLLSGLPEHQPLAIGFAYEPCAQIEAAAVLTTLTDAVTRYIERASPTAAEIQPLVAAAAVAAPGWR